MKKALSASSRQELNEIEYLLALLEPHHGIGGYFQIPDDAITVDDHRSGALDEQDFVQFVLVVDVMVRIGKHRKWQVQDLGITPGFVDRLAQDQHDFNILLFEILMQPAQLGGMAPALHSVEGA